MTRDPLATINRRSTPQTEQADPRQVKNSAGGYVFKVSDEDTIRRFLILGTEGGTYYQGEAELTKQNAKRVFDFAESDPVRLVEIITEISLGGRAPKQNPTIFALAVATTSNNLNGRKAAFDAIPVVIRTGSHLTLFAQYVEQLRGWGTGLKKATQKWYSNKSADQLAYQLLKYRQRNGFTQRDLLRLVHPKAESPEHNALYRWVTQGNLNEAVPGLVHAFTAAQNTTDVNEWVALINDNNLSWEMLPDAALTEAKVWNALLDNGIPLTALIRNLPRLTNLGVIGSALKKGDRTADVVAKITDQTYLQKSRIHPFNVLVANRTYAAGHSYRGSSTWKPSRPIVGALDKAFYKAFGNVEPANKRTLIALDVSGSMGSQIYNSPLRSCEVTACFSLVTAATEPVTETYGFTSGSGGWDYHRSGFSKLNISPDMTLDAVQKEVVKHNFGATDCSLPFTKALEFGLEVDTFLVLTDNETYAGGTHVHQALKKYRDQTGIPAKLIVGATTATPFTIGDPSDKGTLNLAGIDSSWPSIVSDFSAGRI